MRLVIYLDNCALARLDDVIAGKRHQREAEHVRAVLRLCREGKHQYVFSGWLAFEIGELVKDQVKRLKRYRNIPPEIFYVPLDNAVYGTEAELIERATTDRIDPKDALHVASAIRGGADFLITVDRALLRWGRKVGKIQGVTLVSPARFCGVAVVTSHKKKKATRPETFDEGRRRWNPSLDEIKRLVKQQGTAPLEEFLLARSDPFGIESVVDLLPRLGDLSDEELLAKRNEIKRCLMLLQRVQKFVRMVDFSEHVMGLTRALGKAEAREAARVSNQAIAS